MKALILTMMVVFSSVASADHKSDEVLQEIRSRVDDTLAQSFVVTESFLVADGYRLADSFFESVEPSAAQDALDVRVRLVLLYSKVVDVQVSPERRLTRKETVTVFIECFNSNAKHSSCERMATLQQQKTVEFVGGSGFSSSSGRVAQ